MRETDCKIEADIDSEETAETAEAVRELAALLVERGKCVAAAESLTCGMIASSFGDAAGCSRWFSHGYVTYSDAAKTEMLGVDAALIRRYTAVSAETALAMAEGALVLSGADVSVAVTGIAGPGPDEFGREAGLVYIAAAFRGGSVARRFRFSGDRGAVRRKTNREAVLLVKRLVQNLL